MNTRRTLIVLLCVLLTAILATVALAEGVAPCYSHTNVITADITREGNVITSYGDITALPSDTPQRTHITVYLQRMGPNGWQTVDWWADNQTNNFADAIGHVAVEEGYSYRTRSIGKIFTMDWTLLEKTICDSPNIYY